MAKAGNKLALYSYFRSSCSWRVRIALELKGLTYEYRPVHLVKGEQRASEYEKEVNPLCQVPALVTEEGQVLTQSVANIEYLEEQYRDRGQCLLPSDPLLRGWVREVTEVINSGTQPIQNLGVMNSARETAEGRAEWSRRWIENGLRAVEKLLQKNSGGQYSVGNSVTVADCCLVPQVYNAERYKVDMGQFPRIVEVVGRLAGLGEFARAHPKAQPDCPEELK